MSQKYIEGDTFLLTYGDGVAKGRINGGYFVFHRRVFERLQNDPSQIFENEGKAPWSIANAPRLRAVACGPGVVFFRGKRWSWPGKVKS